MMDELTGKGTELLSIDNILMKANRTEDRKLVLSEEWADSLKTNVQSVLSEKLALKKENQSLRELLREAERMIEPRSLQQKEMKEKIKEKLGDNEDKN